MRIDIITAIPCEMRSALDVTVLRRASDVVDVHICDLREYAAGPHRQIDDYPYGGGSGMVLKPEPIFACVNAISGCPDEIIFLTPDGEPFTQGTANQLSLAEHIVLLAGHYKGVDQRVRDVLITREISIGDYVVSGGELPALVLVDAVTRVIPGALGDAQSALFDSFQDQLLGAPTYTRPPEYNGLRVPDVLRSGDHARISAWRAETRLSRTQKRRPDLLAKEAAG